MAKALHVRGIPDELYEALRSAAAEDGRSISAETIAILKKALAERLVARAQIMLNVEQRRLQMGSGVEGVDLVKMIREDRDR
ncbi:MAG: Arc family DNA-binding protein [Actinomycetota bacterium]|nr:Arc family DNA-binding protein [Actinomycetota bacterium]